MKKLLLLFLLVPALALATGKKTPMNQQHQKQHQGQEQTAKAVSESYSESASHSESSSSASSNNSVEINENTVYKQSAPELVLIPHNNTASCQRVFGFGGSRPSGGAIFGIPFTSTTCIYEQDADDAMAAGQYSISYFWDCHKKKSYKPFKERGDSKEEAIQKCYDKMMSMHITIEPPVPEPPAPIDIDIQACCSDKRKCGSDHPEIHKRIFEQCQTK